MWHSNKPNDPAKSAWQALAWLALAICLAYGYVLATPFQFDDYKVIVHYAGVHSWEGWLRGIGHGIRSLLKASYTLDWTVGLGAAGFHTTNLLIHLLNGWLVYHLSRHCCERYPSLPAWLPLAIALLFVLHPAHSEAVSYISGRSSSLMSLFYLAGLLAYTHGRQSQHGLYLYLVTPLCFVAALLCKESAVTFPFALLLWERFALAKHAGSLKAQAMCWAILLLAALLFLFNTSYQSHMERSAHFNSLGGNLATQTSGLLWLLRQWLLPLWLNIDPDLPLYRHASAAPLSLLATLGIACTAWLLRRGRPWLSFALAWALLQLLPLYLLLPRLDIANERQLYLAGWPLALALTVELSMRLTPQQARGVLTVLLMTAGLLTLQRNLDYRSEITLWQAAAQHSPRKARVHNNLGYAYLQAGRSEDARREFELALQLDPHHLEAVGNLQRMQQRAPGTTPDPEQKGEGGGGIKSRRA